MPEIKLFPDNGTRIQIGLTGQPGSSQKPVTLITQSSEISNLKIDTDINPSDHNTIQTTKYIQTDVTSATTTKKSVSPAGGISGTLGKDVLSMEFNKSTGIVFGVEGSVNLTGALHKTDVSSTVTGTKIHVHETDKYDKNGQLVDHQNQQQVLDNWQTTNNQVDSQLKWKLGAKAGGSIGIIKKFDESSWRGDLLGGYDFGNKSPYAGSRVTVTNSYGIGVYGQITTDPTRINKTEAIEAGIGVSFVPGQFADKLMSMFWR